MVARAVEAEQRVRLGLADLQARDADVKVPEGENNAAPLRIPLLKLVFERLYGKLPFGGMTVRELLRQLQHLPQPQMCWRSSLAARSTASAKSTRWRVGRSGLPAPRRPARGATAAVASQQGREPE